MTLRNLACLMALLGLLITACDNGGTPAPPPPPPGPVATVTISGSATLFVAKGKTAQLTVTAKDAAGTTITLGATNTIVWTTTDNTVADFATGSTNADVSPTFDVLKDYFDNSSVEPTATIDVSVDSVMATASVIITGLPNLEGSWDVSADGNPATSHALSQVNDRSFILQNWNGFQSGSITDDQITWTEGPSIITYTGTINSSLLSMSGTYSGALSGTWSATKQ